MLKMEVRVHFCLHIVWCCTPNHGTSLTCLWSPTPTPKLLPGFSSVRVCLIQFELTLLRWWLEFWLDLSYLLVKSYCTAPWCNEPSASDDTHLLHEGWLLCFCFQNKMDGRVDMILKQIFWCHLIDTGSVNEWIIKGLVSNICDQRFAWCLMLQN